MRNAKIGMDSSMTRPGAVTRAPMFNRGVNHRAARNTVNNGGLFRTNNATRATGYRNTAVNNTRTSTITFIILLSAIVALLALAIYALMRRPRYEHGHHSHHGISDNDSANRRR